MNVSLALSVLRVFSMALGLGSNQLRLQGCIPGKGCMDHWTAVVP